MGNGDEGKVCAQRIQCLPGHMEMRASHPLYWVGGGLLEEGGGSFGGEWDLHVL
jgi:hypothetical protein